MGKRYFKLAFCVTFKIRYKLTRNGKRGTFCCCLKNNTGYIWLQITVVYSMTWPLDRGEGGVDRFVLKQTSLLFICKLCMQIIHGKVRVTIWRVG